MEGFNVGKIIFGLRHPEMFFRRLHIPEQNPVQNFLPENFTPNSKPQPRQLVQNIQNLEMLTQQLQMNKLPNVEKSAFIKNLLGLPQNLGEVLVVLQNPKLPLNGGTLGLANINQELLQNQKTIATIFEDKPQVINNPKIIDVVEEIVQIQNTQVQKSETAALFFSGMISMNDVSKLILQNGKQAVASLIIAMASASKQGMNSDQIRETLSVINSCISMAESNNPAQSLKSLMMLYIPWLPLNEGVGFDLEVTTSDGETDSNNSKLIVLIQTKNYGNVKGEFILTTSNSVEVLIICAEGFPKKTLLENLKNEGDTHAMNTNIDIEEVQAKETTNEVQEAKVNLSATNEMNPYLLLMAHSFIRNTIMIDNNAIIEEL